MLLRQVATVRWQLYTLGREPIHANANVDADARDPFLVPCFSLVSAQAFAVYRMDPHVVVLYPSALGCSRVALSTEGAGPDLYSCASGVRFVVLDTPGGRDHGMEWIRGSSQQEKDAKKANLARWSPDHLPAGLFLVSKKASICLAYSVAFARIAGSSSVSMRRSSITTLPPMTVVLTSEDLSA
jgi:hypothetical protein